jgi:hypothetical protein
VSNTLQRPIEERVGSFRQYYAMKNERPLLGFFCGSEYPLHRYPAARAIPEGQPLTPDDFAVEPYLDDCDALFAQHEACGGDFIWAASAFWGIPWLEAALGCDIVGCQETGSIHSETPAWFHGPDTVAAFDRDNAWSRKMAEFLDKMAERSAGRWPLATTRMRGISDLLSALYGGDEMVFAMMEEPDEVKAVAAKLTDFFIAWGKLQLDQIPDFHGGIGSFYYSMWAPKGTIWHQEDAAALLSPDLYKEFIEPCDRRIVDAFDGCIIHQHPTGYYPVDAYLDMGMTALELHIDEGGPSAEQLFDVHKKILAEKPLLIWGDIPEKDLDWIFGNLPSQGLAVSTVVASSDEAEAVWKRYVGQ